MKIDSQDYANPKNIHKWTTIDWEIWFSTNRPVLEVLEKEFVK